MAFIPRRLSRAAAVTVLLLAVSTGRGSSAVTGGADVLKATLHNGLRVVIVPSTLAPVVATDMTYLVGSRDDPPEFPGMAHAQEHMMFRGTQDLSAAALGTLATALGGDFNASTTETLTQFQFTVPAADLDAVLRVEADRMRDVLDAQDQWENERGAIEQEVINDETQPGAQYFREARLAAFAGTPYAHEGVGTRAAFDRLTGADIKRFYQRWYAPNNAVLVVAGNVDPARTLDQVRERFESIPGRAVPGHVPAALRAFGHAVYRRPSTLPYPLAAVAYRMPGVESPDFLPSYVLQAILDSPRGPLRPLADSGEALDAEWNTEPYLPEAQLAFATAALGPSGDPAAMAERLQHVVAAYAKAGIPAELFTTTKRRLIADQELSRNTIAALASDWATTIADDNEPSIAREQQLIAAVTLEQVDSVARRYLERPDVFVGALTPSANATSDAPPRPQQHGPEKPLEAQAPVTQLPDWASELVDHITVPPSALSPVQTKLPNGITLIVQPESISDSVFVFGSVRNEPQLEEPAGKEGVARVLAAMFAYGSKSADRMTMQRAQDDADAQIAAGPQFEVETSAQTFDRAIRLLAESELGPRFDGPTFETAQRREIQELATELNGSHTQAMDRAARRLLPPGDPELREPTVEGMNALTLADVEAYYAKTFRPDLTTIVVVGKVTPEAARSAIERAFGAWHASGEPPALELPSVPLNAPADVVESLPGSGQDYVTLEQIVPVARSSAAYYPLVVGNAILGGGTGGPEQSRLFRDLRQNAGLVYSIGSQFAAERTRASLTISFACLPENEPKIAAAIDDEIRTLQSQAVSPFELALVKASLVRRTVLAAGSVATIGEGLLDASQNGYPLDRAQVDARGYVATDASAVKDAFDSYVHPDRFVRVIEGP